MRSIDANGKSIDEAIFNGLQMLEVSIDEVDIEILQQETKGVFGIGARPAIVRLTEKEPEDVVLPEYMERSSERRSQRQERPRRDDRQRGRQRGNKDNPNQQPRRDEHALYTPPPEFTLELAENEPAAVFLRGLLYNMNIDAKVLAAPKRQDDDGVRLLIDGDSMGVLIGRRGETLDAIQYLTSLHVNRNRKEEGYTRVTIDIEGYREKREETLARLAKKVAAQVKATGRPRALEPMNPYERRVLHATLQNNPYVTTHSEGEEPNRRVVVEPK